MRKLHILSLLLCFLVLNGHALDLRNKIVMGKSAFAIGSFLTEMRNMGDIDLSLSAGSTMNAENGPGQLEALADRMSTRASPALHAKFLSSLPRPLEDQEYWAAHASDFDNHVHNFLAHALSATHHEDLPEFLETGARSGSQEAGCTSTENCEAIEGFFARNACKARRGTANAYNGARNWADDKVGDLIGADELKSAMESVNQVNRKLESVPQGGNSQGLTFVDILVALLFGIFNGFTMGLGESLHQDIYKIRDDPVCQRSFAAIKSSFLSIITSVFNLLYGTFSRRARNCMTISDWLGAHINQTIQHFGRLFTAIWELVTTCEPLQKLLFMLGFMLVICLIFVLILWALPGVGWIAYIVGVVMTVIFGVPFLWDTIKKLARGISAVSSNRSNRQAWISIIEAVAEIVGFVACILLTSGAMKLITKAGRAEIMAMVSRNAMVERLGATFRPNPRAIDMVRRFAGMTKAAEDGVTAAKAAEMAAFSRQTPPITQNADEAAQAAARRVETAAARQPRVTPPETPRAPARRTPPVEAPPSAPISAVDDTARSATTAASTTDETARITAGAEGAAIVDDTVKPTIAREGGPTVNTADEAARVEGAVANNADETAKTQGAAPNTADDVATAEDIAGTIAEETTKAEGAATSTIDDATKAEDTARNAVTVTEAEVAVARATEKVTEVTNNIRTKTRELERLLEAQRNEVPRTVRSMEHRGNGNFDLGPERTVASRYLREINKVRSEISALERQAAQARANLALAQEQLELARAATIATSTADETAKVTGTGANNSGGTPKVDGPAKPATGDTAPSIVDDIVEPSTAREGGVPVNNADDGSILNNVDEASKPKNSGVDEAQNLRRGCPYAPNTLGYKYWPLRGWRNGYYFEVPSRLARLTFEQYKKLNGAKASTKEEYERVKGSRIRTEENHQPAPAAETNCWELPKYHFFDQYPSCQIDTPGEQGDCSSCWAYATTTSLTHRLCKAIVDARFSAPPGTMESRLSPQKILSCKDGGPCEVDEVLLAHLVIEEDFVEPMSATPYNDELLRNSPGPTECQKLKNSTGRVRVSGDFPFMLSGERQMKEAICTGGPITAIMETSDDFVGASGEGVFRSDPSITANNSTADLGDHFWHAVSISGWGVHNGTNYWVVENSWGSIYERTRKMIANHNRGFVLVHRGSDEMKLESTPSFAQEPLLRVGRERVSVSDGWRLLQGDNPRV